MDATGGSLNRKTMRDREFVNRFCAFQLLGVDDYYGDMDDFLAKSLRRMNTMEEADLSLLSDDFRRSLANNFLLFGRHAFRKHAPDQDRRVVLNASLWDVMTTGFSRYEEGAVRNFSELYREAVYGLLDDEEFVTAITYGPNDARKVRRRFEMTWEVLERTIPI